MKVLHIVSAYPRFEGDVITPWLVETVRRLRKQGVEITIFAPSYRGLGDQTIYGTPVKRFRYFFKKWENLTHEETAPDRVNRSLFYKFLVILYILFGSVAIALLCRQERFDLIHVHWPVPHALFGFVGKKVSKAGLILSFYGVELRWVKKSLPFLSSFVKWALKKADLVTCISTHTRDEILSFSSRPATIIPFGAGLEIRAGKGPAAHPPEILFVGRLVERKGVKFLIDAFASLAREMECRLLIVGDGPDRKALEKQSQSWGLENRVVFTGAITEEQLRERYRSCSVFVLPAITDLKGDTEGLGVVLIEALAYQKPVVASGVGGILDIVESGKTGILVPEKDSQALSQAIKKLLGDPRLSQRLAEEGHKLVQDKFAWTRIIEQVLQAYESCRSGKRLSELQENS